jgi:glycosyltransferase involved in cell wall biosynthesis
MKATLSVSMIVRDESEHLAGALENLRQFADEVVVLDTGSTDDTKRLAEAAGAVVRDFQWCDDFAKARYLKRVRAEPREIFPENSSQIMGRRVDMLDKWASNGRYSLVCVSC